MIFHGKYDVKPMDFAPTPNPMVCAEEMNLLLNFCIGRSSILEIGTWKGITTANMIMTGVHITTIDVTEAPHTIKDGQNKSECMPAHLIGQEIPKNLRKNCDIVLYNPNTTNGLKQTMAKINKKFDLIVIDGDHSYEGVTKDYHETLPYLKDTGIMIFHDCWWNVNPHPVFGPMRFLSEQGGIILNRTHYGMLLKDLENLWLRS